MITEILRDEYWWGGNVHDGADMPYHSKSSVKIDLRCPSPNQSASLFLSSKGRYIYGEEPFCIQFENGIIKADGTRLYVAGSTLKDAYLAAVKNHIGVSGTIPDGLFFTMPQYNTWIALNHNQTQNGVLNYAEEIVRLKLPPGILMIDACWERYFGELDFDRSRFPDPKGMTDILHGMGFKVMLWVSPCISPDSAVFRELRNTPVLLHDKNGEPAVRKWWDGYSAVLDLTCPEAQQWFESRLNRLMNEYGADGFKLDAGDSYFYKADDKACKPGSPQSQTHAFADFAKRFPLNELRTGWNNGGSPCVFRLADKHHSWDGYGLNMLLPNTFVQGLLGYTYCCPDMIGGGEYMQFNKSADSLDKELFVRYAQVAALMPMMQFSALPSCLKNCEAEKMIADAAELHRKLGGYILKTAQNSAKTGEPVMRHMCYSYPDCGFETVNGQFMLGNDILAAPVLEKGAVEKQVALPPGQWLYVPGGTTYEGGTTVTVPAPLDVPVWFKKLEGEM